jgi:hypothetical protein
VVKFRVTIKKILCRLYQLHVSNHIKIYRKKAAKLKKNKKEEAKIKG